jgi:hypothetical protein
LFQTRDSRIERIGVYCGNLSSSFTLMESDHETQVLC